MDARPRTRMAFSPGLGTAAPLEAVLDHHSAGRLVCGLAAYGRFEFAVQSRRESHRPAQPNLRGSISTEVAGLDLQRIRQSKLARNAGWMLAGQGFKLAVQAVYFTVIARSLGVEHYGAFVGVVGLVGIFAPFGSLGSGYLLIKNVARDRTRFRENWGAALLTTLLSSSLLFGLVLLLSRFLLPAAIPLKLVGFVAGSDLFGISVAGICGQAFVAFERMKWTAAFNVLQSALRMTAAIGLAAFESHPSAMLWAGFYFASTMVVAVIAVLAVLVKLGYPKFEASRTLSEVREGLYFSINQSAETIYNDIDKTMLARLGTHGESAVHRSASR